MKRALLVAFALTLGVAAAAFARDRNHDRIPDRWEARHHLSTHRNVAHRDPDRDHASNLAEFRHRTNPRDADTDNDGVKDGAEFAEHTNARDDDSDDDGVHDGDEVAGHVKSFDGTTLVITLNDNSEISGAVTDATKIECEGSDEVAHASHEGDDNSGPGSGDDRGDDDRGDDDDERDDENCSKADLTPGAVVHEAELEATSSGKVFEEVELVK